VNARPRAAISWSGGKDSCAALMRAWHDYQVVAMITMFDEAAARSRSHGLRPEVLEAQAARLRLRQYVGRCTWPTYNQAFSAALAQAAADGITHVIFGDIVYDEHRLWAEQQCAAHRLTAVEPLFGCSTLDLFNDWVRSGAEATIVTARAEHLDRTWLGRRLEASMLPELLAHGVDPCGERGEYHTVVTNAPLYDRPLPLLARDSLLVSGCWALDYEVADAERP
jgi:uncharacterized protein (TIGR00290 family)